MLRRSVITPTRPKLHFLDDEPVSSDAPLASDWVLRTVAAELPRTDEEDDGLGVRALLDRPEAQVEAWRATERSRSPGRRHRDARARARRAR